MTDVGMNLAPNQFFGTEFPFIDRMKTASGWSAYGVTPTMDAYGNPTSIPAGYALVQTQVALDPVSASMTDIYELTWSGTATFQVPGATVISSQPGKLVFQWNGPQTGANIVIRSISATDPVHDVHIVRQDQVAAFQQGEIFNSEFLAQVSNWQTLRFMDWGNINNLNSPMTWEDRAHVSDATWQDGVGAKGVPIEVMIQLANEANADMWFNIPTQADDTYVRNALQLIKDRLAPGLKVHVEYSNEVWNTIFQQTKYAQDMANKLWGKDVNHDGVIDGTNPAEAVNGGNNIYYGYRSAQIAAIANSVFTGTNDNRLEMVFATQANNTIEKYLFDGIARANAGSVGALFDEWSTTAYFGLEMSGYTAADKAKVLGWAASGQAGIDAAFQELAHGGVMDIGYSIDDIGKVLKYEKALADRYGLDFVGYEGGFHGSALGYGADQSAVLDFFTRLMADPRMEDLYKYLYDTFSNAGGSMLAAYYDVRQPSNAGIFGALNSLYDDKTPRYNALLSEAGSKDMSSDVDYSAILSDLHPKATVGKLSQTVGAQDQQIVAMYQAYAGRPPTVDELSAWAGAIGTSQNYGMIKSAILSTSLGNYYIDQQIQAAYQTYAGRAATSIELTNWEGTIRNCGYDCLVVKNGILSDPLGTAYVDAQITAAYQTYAGRAPVAIELTNWEGTIRHAGNDFSVVKNGILSDPLGRAYVDAQITAAYQTYAGRAPAAIELTNWEGTIKSAGNDFSVVKNGILSDPLGKPYVDAQITAAYQTYAGRAPVAIELTNWENTIRNAGNDFSVVKNGILSDPLGRPYVDAQITAAYQTYAGRAPFAIELTNWEGTIKVAGNDFSVVKTGILTDQLGIGYANAQITALYQRYDGQAATIGEQANWKANMLAGADFDTLRDFLLSDGGSAATTTQANGTASVETYHFFGKPYLTISGFDPVHDVINLQGLGFSGINPLDATHARNIHQLDGTNDVFIGLDATHEILLHNVSIAQLSSSDFML